MRSEIIEPLSASLEFIGVAIIVIGLVTASVSMARSLVLRWGWKGTLANISDITYWDKLEADFAPYRRNLLRVIVLGLTFLVAGDIVSTASVDRTLEDVGTLAIIVVIREFLSLALDMETTGHWPWQHRHPRSKPVGDTAVSSWPEAAGPQPSRTGLKGGLFAISLAGVLALAALKTFNLN